MPDSLIGLEGTTMRKNLDSLIISADKSLQIIIPWRGVSTSNQKIERVLQQIQGYSLIYLEAIERSVKAVQNSSCLGSDVMELCGYILDPKTDPNDIWEFLPGLQSNAHAICEDVTRTLAKFADVRESLNTMNRLLPKEVTTKDGAISKYFGRFGGFGSKEANERDVVLDAAMAELNLGVIDLTALSQGIYAFETWWKGVEMIAKETNRGASQLTASSSGQEIETLREDWATVLTEYERYISQIVKAQDQYQAQLLAPVPDDLSRLEINTPHKILNSIVDSAYKNFHLFGLGYYEAIDLSIDTAQHGFDFGGDAIQLCDSLLNPDTKMEALREYIQDMKDKAQGAQEDCTNTLNKFRKLRESLKEIIKKTPEEITERESRTSHFGDKTKAKRDIGLLYAITERNLQSIDFGILDESLERFASWLTGIEHALESLTRSSSSLRPAKDKLRVKQLQKSWSGTQEDYRKYKTKVIQLQVYYPSK
ncbi:hypothetical protein M408DRAFT_11600 [Serendipita vermifera MAFF 305830]|uniref:Uncharacterized protein n=1 Tax=Serendipita vermifera MAFF 305830 TaxID=933852 RepID=A0A0C3AVL3_SERVB|nr:hypothetical protein M408DRAFT_11600 [Serendipita vermifera MAFF 305830]